MNISNEKTEVKVSFNTEKVYPALENLEVTPSMEEQHFKSEKYGYNEVAVLGDKNLIAENIKKDVEIFGIIGENEGIDTSDATATSNDIIATKTAYVNGEKVEGLIPNNGELNYTLTSEIQTIPAGYTSGGTISPVDFTKSEDYKTCNTIAKNILGEVVFEPLDYIQAQASLSQYIDTGIVPTPNTVVEMEFMLGATVDWEQFFGVTGAIQLVRNGTKSQLYVYDSGKSVSSINVQTNIFYKIKVGNGSVYVNNTLQNTYTSSFSTDKTMYVFYQNGGDRCSNMALKKFTISKNNQVIMNLLPCRDQNSKVCMYDTISKKFFYNLGQGEFIAGEVE